MRIRPLPFLLTCAWTASLPLCLGAAEVLKFPSTPPTAAKDAAKTFHALDGFSMKPLASEPLVTSPVAVAYDEDGRAYVCEMNDYPYTDKAQHKPSQENPTDQPIGSIRLLEDVDGDGVFDKSTVFAEGLSWPTGVCCWKGGIFVTATPDVWYLKDTDGDGKADVRQKVFTGFRKLNVQAVMNNPVWGLDHRIYVAGGTNGATITRPDVPDFKSIAIKRNDFSFDPITLEVNVETGGARFGNSFDDWGNRFLCNIRNPCQQVLLSNRLLVTNPYQAINGLVDCAEAGDQLPVYRTSPIEPWREFRAQRWSAAGSHLPKSELVGAGVVTSSAGITVYRGDAYPAEYREFAFVADVAGNLFYRMKLVPEGISFKSVQVDGQKNFCTSDDVWFRPVNFVNAPDGCLHVCDMYREVIEHPWSIPDDIHASLDLLRGRDKGRIYRLEPEGFKRRAPSQLSQANNEELVALLDHPNAWHRETAHRLLFERQDRSVVPALQRLLTQGKTAQGRIHALWSLEGLGEFGSGKAVDFRKPNRLSDKIATDRLRWQQDAGINQNGYRWLLTALADKDPQVRRQVIRMRPEALLAPRGLDEFYKLRSDVRHLFDDSDLQVRIEAILHHALVRSPASLAPMGDLCVREEAEPQVLQAVLLATAESSFPVFQQVLKSPKVADSPALQEFLSNCATMMGRAYPKGDPDAPGHVMRHLIGRGEPDMLARRVVGALALAVRRGGFSLLQATASKADERYDREYQSWLGQLKAQVLADLVATQAAADTRVQALALLPDLLPAEEGIAKLVPFLAATQAVEVQLAALDALSSYRNAPTMADALLAVWQSLSPSVREKALSVLLAFPERTKALLIALEGRKVPLSHVTTSARTLLVSHKDKAIAEKAQRIFGNAQGNRQSVIEKYLKALAQPGDAVRGKDIYQLACMVCHRHKGQGNDVGPNLGTVQAWTPDQLLTNILDPNREVSPNFAMYIIECRDGRSITGLIASETEGSLTMKRPDGGQEDVLRSEIKSITSPGISLMPDGLEAAITPEQMADLIAYLREL